MPNQGNPGAPKPEVQVQVEQNIVNNINNVRPSVQAPTQKDMADPILAVYHRSMEEIEKMPVIEKTMTVCPECKLIINGIIYKDGDNVMIRKYCPEHQWTIEKYWEDYDMYMKMKRYNYYGRGFDNPNYISDTKGANCPFDCGMCERHKSHTGLANVVVTNRCHLSCWYCFFYAKEGEAIYEPSLAELDKIFRNLRAQKPIPANAIQITGGEPTMAPDIIGIIQKAKEAGFDQIQLNTTGINLGLNPDLAVKLRHAGVSTLYMSFDGVSPKANPKNHWETPLALKAARRAGIGVVLVPTVIRTINDHELGAMINFALNNSDIVKAINFQPVSLVGRMPSRLREKQRITIPGAIKLIEEQTNGVIGKDAWFSVPYVGGINKFIEALTGEYKYDLSIHFACGAGSYLFIDTDNKIVPLTKFVDAQGLLEHLQRAVDEMQGKSKTTRKLIAVKALLGLNRYIDKQYQPKSVNFSKLLLSILTKHDFASMGKLQMKSMFIGMMHFQDEYTYDIHRVEKCDIHYAQPNGEVMPFCSFNVFPEMYRDKVQRQYSMPALEWEKTHPNWAYAKDKYTRNIKELEASEEYTNTYGKIIDYFALPVNGGGGVANFATARPKIAQQVVVQNAAGKTSEVPESTDTKDSCGCGGGGSCGCESNAEGSGGCGCGNC
ncbi:MAG: radical SAM protein [Candidatus Marsarchaeota archaeon]|nr:radical SAM protein [Candidatus Marsarchaeota archaeon]MCL5111402.1 radical SAM protein [Candidatus Marsarchaeota archaeon]